MAINATIQVRRGLKADFDPTKMLPGEWAVSIDASTSNQIVWMCFAPGVCKRMGTYEDFKSMISQANGEIIEELRGEFEAILAEVESVAKDVNADKEEVLVVKSEILDTYIPQIQNYVNTASTHAKNAKASETNAKASENNAKVSETNASESASEAKTYAEQALSTTPDGYNQMVTDVDLLKNSIVQTTDRTLYGSKEGGIKLIGIKGASEQKQYSGKNLVEVENMIFTTSDTTEREFTKVHLTPGTYTLSWTQNETLTSNQRNTPLYRVDGGGYDTTKWYSTSANVNLSKGRYSWTIEITEENDYSFLYWAHTASNDVSISEIQLALGTDTDYEPYVGATQSPNPIYPQEIESVGDLKNLLEVTATSQTANGVTFTVNEDKTITANGTATEGNAYLLFGSVDLKAGETYIVSGCPSGGASTTYYVYPAGLSSAGYRDYGNGLEYTPSVDETRNVSIVIISGTTLDNAVIKPMVRKASVQNAEYKPYGYSIGIKAEGKNRYNPNTDTRGIVGDDGTFTNNASYRTSDYMKVHGNVTMSAVTSSSSMWVRCALYDENKTFIVRKAYDLGNSQTATLNVDDFGCKYLRVSYEDTESVYLTDLQVELGTATPYEPYRSKSITIPLSEPLRGIGEVKDEIVYQGGVWGVLRKIVSVVVDNTISLSTHGTKNGNYRYSIPTSAFGKIANAVSDTEIAPVRCTHYCAITSSDTYGEVQGVGVSTGGRLYVYDSAFNTADITLYQAWLAENPITVEYDLATPTFEPFTDQTPFYGLESFDTVTYISTDSEIEPTVELKFAKTEGDAVTLLNYNQTNLNRIAIAELTSAVLALNQE